MLILDFEKSLFELDDKVKELKNLSTKDMNILEEIKRLESKQKKLLKKIYAELKPWEKVLVARHQDRPKTSDYINALIEDFVPLAGDRIFGNDFAITAGIGRFQGLSVAILGHEKGRDTEERIKHNFGMPHPEGYRKACRLMDLADRFQMPLITFIDTAGAYPGVGAEERGQSEAIAKCIARALKFDHPIISVIIGEGGSGGAVALAVANVIAMLEYSVYSVISPEGCASILYRDAAKAEDAANALRLTSQDLLKFKMIDCIIPEPLGGAHRDSDAAVAAVGNYISSSLLSMSNVGNLRKHRTDKFLGFCRNCGE
ncbi:MAG: acetyl-CoA carboxylase carboxyltransferase subunit alpha [Holosporaceae bacterium]|jgi:acetyl-CoA carboxylase carboxyl transferase subunit alpha|nr:acetyl-CoA carboxylase carboxyltransferase subunit alpha [Holosporaceae bacterium]